MHPLNSAKVWRLLKSDMQYGELAEVYDLLIYDMPYDKWMNFIEKNFSGRTVLELGCGTGNMTVRLAQKYELTAIDISDEMLRKADEKLRKNGRRARLATADMTSFVMNKPVDLVLCACDGINYLTELSQVDKTFANVHKNLKENGLFIFDISSRNKLRAMNDQLYSEDTDDVTYIWRNSYDNEKNTISMDISFFLAQGEEEYIRFDENHLQRAHDVSEIKQLLEKNSFEIISISDDYSEEKVKEDTARITFCARAI